MAVSLLRVVCIALVVALATASPTPEDEPRICCMAVSANCLACAEGVTVEQYCAQNPDMDGCGSLKQPAPPPGRPTRPAGGGGFPTRPPGAPTRGPRPTRPSFSGPTIVALLQKDPLMTTLVKAVVASGIDKYLASTYTSFTVFAPTNAAFAKIPADTLAKILGEPLTLQNIIKMHIKPSGYGGMSIASSDLKDGDVIQMMNRQGLTVGISAGVVTLTNGNQKSAAKVTKVDQTAAGSNGVYHDIDTVLMPATGGTAGTTCTSDQGPCATPPRCPPVTGFPTGCVPSVVKTWSPSATCCVRPCEFRQDGGKGAVCELPRRTRPPPFTTVTKPGDTTAAALPDCPMACEATFKACLTKGYKKADCLGYASKGYLCRDASSHGVKCNGLDLLSTQPQCADVQTYSTCGGCQATCEDTRPPCTKMCHSGCFCPKELPVFDNAQGKCVTFDNCPAADTCESSIEADYLDAGGVAAKCANTDQGDVCTTTCDTQQCVAQSNYADTQKVMDYCGKLTTSADCTKVARYCKWDGAATPGASGPTFVCSGGSDDGDTAWAIQDEGACQAGGGVDDSVCDFITQTDCLDKGKCDITGKTYTQCFGLVKSTYSACQTTCFAASHLDKKCGACLIDNLFKTNTLNLKQPDIFSCCGCLDETFAKVGLQKEQLEQLIDGPCKKHSATDDDDADA